MKPGLQRNCVLAGVIVLGLVCLWEMGRWPFPQRSPTVALAMDRGEDDLVPVEKHSSARTSQARELAQWPLREGLSLSDRLTLHWDGTNLAQAFAIYGALTHRTLTPSAPVRIVEGIDDLLGKTLSRSGMLARPAMAPSGLELHRDGLVSVAEVREQCEKLFAAQRLRVVPVGQSRFRVVNSATLSPKARTIVRN